MLSHLLLSSQILVLEATHGAPYDLVEVGLVGRGLGAFIVWVVLLSSIAAVGQDNSARLTFEVASVRASDLSRESGSVQPLPNGVGYTVDGLPLRDMLSVMYRVPQRQISGGPAWVYTENFDVYGRTDRAYSIDDLHLMFENLLAERFHLKLHFVNEPGPVYVLRVAKSGVKMKAVPEGTDRHSPIRGSEDHVEGDRVPLKYLSWWLRQILQSDRRPVVDATGLTGTYNFTLRFRPQEAPSADEGEDLPSIFQALREQLGLELVPETGVVTRLVIDSVEKTADN